jgi:hypothetical protein
MTASPTLNLPYSTARLDAPCRCGHPLYEHRVREDLDAYLGNYHDYIRQRTGCLAHRCGCREEFRTPD